MTTLHDLQTAPLTFDNKKTAPSSDNLKLPPKPFMHPAAQEETDALSLQETPIAVANNHITAVLMLT